MPRTAAGAIAEVVAVAVQGTRAVVMGPRVAGRMVTALPARVPRRVAARAVPSSGVPATDGAPVNQGSAAQVIVLARAPAGVAETSRNRAMVPTRAGVGGPRSMGSPASSLVPRFMRTEPQATPGEAKEGVPDGPVGPETIGRPGAGHVVADGVARPVAGLGVPGAGAARAATGVVAVLAVARRARTAAEDGVGSAVVGAGAAKDRRTVAAGVLGAHPVGAKRSGGGAPLG